MSNPLILYVNRIRLVILSLMYFIINKYIFHSDISFYVGGYFFVVYLVDYIFFKIKNRKHFVKYDNYSGIIGAIFSIVLFLLVLNSFYNEVYLVLMFLGALGLDFLIRRYFFSSKSGSKNHLL
jgi:hypothetical protein